MIIFVPMSETLTDVKARFDRLKEYMVEDRTLDKKPEPTDKEVWEQLKANATQHRDEAMADDMEYYVMIQQQRLKIIEEQLKSLQ